MDPPTFGSEIGTNHPLSLFRFLVKAAKGGSCFFLSSGPGDHAKHPARPMTGEIQGIETAGAANRMFARSGWAIPAETEESKTWQRAGQEQRGKNP